MDLLRLDTKDHGPVFVRPENVACIGRIDDESCNVAVVLANGKALDLTMAADADEIAQSIERVLPGCRIHRVI